jgi:Putative Actinobacterial Holin-X, holin superfamily III
MADPGAASQEPRLAALLAQLLHDAQALLLQQLALFRAEIGENAGKLLGGVLVVLAGIAVAVVGGLALLAAVILLLGRLMPLWAASAATGLAVASIGAALVLYGRRLIARASVMPRQSLQSLRETGDWLREELM